MKFSPCNVAVCLIALSCTRLCSASSSNTPVERVVKLLTDLKEKILHDGADEKAVFEKFSCWCTGMTSKKGKAIEDAKDDLKQLGDKIMSLKSDVAKYTADIHDASQDMKDNEESQKEATEIRQKENTAFTALRAELDQALAAIQKALTMLGSSVKSSALLQKSKSISTQTLDAVRAAIDAIPDRALGSLPAKKIAQLQSLSTALGKAGYNPGYDSIVGILQEMHSIFSKDLEKETKSEETATEEYTTLMSTKVDELIALQKKIAKKEKDKAEAAVELSHATQDYDDTEAQMEADIFFFDETVESCEKKKEEWDERSKLRDEELEGVKKAIEILTTDEARELFNEAMDPKSQRKFRKDAASFLQVDAMPAGQKKAFQVLKVLATKTQSFTLAQVAAQVRLANGGHFDKVIAAIDKVIGVLKTEQEDDNKKKEQCEEEYFKINKTSADLDWKIDNNKAAIVKLELTIEEAEKEKAITIEKLAEVKKQMEEMKKAREAEKKAFEEAKKDDEDSIALLKKAKEALLAYYEKHDITSAYEAMIQEEPEFDRGDLAPDAKFSGKDKRALQTKSIVSLMGNIINDLEVEIENEVKAEEEAVEAYEKALKAAEELEEALEKRKANLEKAIADDKKDKVDEEDKKDVNEKDLKDETDYKTKITNDCDFAIDQWQSRYDKRKAEMDGLVEAKDYLSGAKKHEGELSA